MDRAHRIGQTKPVVVYRLITEGTVEEMVIERSQKKLYLDAAVIQQGRLAESSKSLSKDEILGMVRFGADAVFSAGACRDLDPSGSSAAPLPPPSILCLNDCPFSPRPSQLPAATRPRRTLMHCWRGAKSARE